MAIVRPNKLKKRSGEEDEIEEIQTFDSLIEIGDKIEELATQAEKTKDKIEKKKLLTDAQRLAVIYQARCEARGNHVKQFKDFI